MTAARFTSLLLCVCALITVTGVSPVKANATPSPVTSASPSPPPSPQVLRLQAQAAALEQQILALQEQSAPFQLQAMQVQQQAAAEQTQLATAQVELASANVALADTTVRLSSVQATLQSDRQRLASLVLASYRITTSGTALTVLLNSRNLVDAIDTVVTLGHVTHSMDTLVADVRGSADQLTALQSQQRDEQQQIAAQVNAVQGLRSQALTDEARFQQEAGQLTGKAATMTRRLEVLMVRLAAAEGAQAATVAVTGNAAASIAGALPPFAFGPQVDDFPWGQCTWYVASLRPVTWGGDAWEWQAAAAAQGNHEGLVPKPGAIVVFGRGNGYGDLGHVAYVQTVVGPTSFIIDEANAYGLGVVDKRLVTSLTDVEAFIY